MLRTGLFAQMPHKTLGKTLIDVMLKQDAVESRRIYDCSDSGSTATTTTSPTCYRPEVTKFML